MGVLNKNKHCLVLNMIHNKAVLIAMINVILMQCYRNTVAYTQISTDGNGSADGGGPKIYKALNFDLIFPKSFNSSENVISTTPETIPSRTNTATSVVGQPHYPLPQSNRPTNTRATAGENQQEPTLFVTPVPTQEPTTPLAAEKSNEAGIYHTQQNTKSNKHNAQVVTQNAINMQEQQQLNDNNKAEKEQQQNYATGRAVDYHTSYPFGQVITPLIKNAPHPVYRKPVTSFSTLPSSSSSSLSSSSLAAAKLAATSNVDKIIYPQAMYQQKPPSQAEIDKIRGKGKFIDRFTPSEGVASHAFKSNNYNSHDHSHELHNRTTSYKPAGKTPSAFNVVNSYVTPTNLYAFPPNNVNYPMQTQDTKVPLSSATVNSYSWPASGSLKDSKHNLNTATSNSSPYRYNGPVSANYLPPVNEGDNIGSIDEGKNNDGNGDGGGDADLYNGGGDDSVGVLPASAMDQGNGSNNGEMSSDIAGDMDGSMDSQDDKIPDDNSYDTEKEYPTPPPGWLKEHPQFGQDHLHHNHHPRKPDIEFEHDDFHHQPDIIFDHDHYHHSIPSYPSYPTHHHYPEIAYDDHHHEHPHIEPPPPTTSTEIPPPEPRVKKYSYFYIGRKLWYIPLYFTVWFSFYVLWLILKSIARHKVNLPNHYVSRRSVDNFDFSQSQHENINQLTVSILDKIDKFKRIYKT